MDLPTIRNRLDSRRQKSRGLRDVPEASTEVAARNQLRRAPETSLISPTAECFVIG